MSDEFFKELEFSAKKGIDVKNRFVLNEGQRLANAVEMILQALYAGNKVLIFGNGGSASDAQHMAAEFVNRFKKDRPPLAALALTTDTSVITSIGNDYSFDDIFERQVAALGCVGDVAIGISTSGESLNVIKGIQKAKMMNMKTIGLSGNKGGKLKELSDLCLVVECSDTAMIQEIHLFAEHMICEFVEKAFFA